MCLWNGGGGGGKRTESGSKGTEAADGKDGHCRCSEAAQRRGSGERGGCQVRGGGRSFLFHSVLFLFHDIEKVRGGGGGRRGGGRQRRPEKSTRRRLVRSGGRDDDELCGTRQEAAVRARAPAGAHLAPTPHAHRPQVERVSK